MKPITIDDRNADWIKLANPKARERNIKELEAIIRRQEAEEKKNAIPK